MAEFHRDVAESFMTGRSLKQEELQRAQIHALLAINDSMQEFIELARSDMQDKPGDLFMGSPSAEDPTDID